MASDLDWIKTQLDEGCVEWTASTVRGLVSELRAARAELELVRPVMRLLAHQQFSTVHRAPALGGWMFHWNELSGVPRGNSGFHATMAEACAAALRALDADAAKGGGDGD